jgi:hypothetical protein
MLMDRKRIPRQLQLEQGSQGGLKICDAGQNSDPLLQKGAEERRRNTITKMVGVSSRRHRLG